MINSFSFFHPRFFLLDVWVATPASTESKSYADCDYRGIHADVIVYIFAHLHTTLHTQENLLGVYWLQATKELVKVKTWLKF